MTSIRARRNVPEESVKQGGQHVLFVEGTEDSFDRQVLRELFRDQLEIRTLGPSRSVRAAAESLHPHHPTYYFVIDRDHQDDDTVEAAWANFPNKDTHNLLIWRRRELESYFLDSSYLSQSGYLREGASIHALDEFILERAQERLYFETANLVITELRESQKNHWIRGFDKLGDFPTADAARDQLRSRPEFAQRTEAIAEALQGKSIIDLFDETLQQLSGGREQLEDGHGNWRTMLPAKKILNDVMTRFFEPRTTSGAVLTGRERLREVAKDLLRRDLSEQPQDFQELHVIMQARLQSPVENS